MTPEQLATLRAAVAPYLPEPASLNAFVRDAEVVVDLYGRQKVEWIEAALAEARSQGVHTKWTEGVRSKRTDPAILFPEDLRVIADLEATRDGLRALLTLTGAWPLPKRRALSTFAFERTAPALPVGAGSAWPALWTLLMSAADAVQLDQPSQPKVRKAIERARYAVTAMGRVLADAHALEQFQRGVVQVAGAPRAPARGDGFRHPREDLLSAWFAGAGATSENMTGKETALEAMIRGITEWTRIALRVARANLPASPEKLQQGAKLGCLAGVCARYGLPIAAGSASPFVAVCGAAGVGRTMVVRHLPGILLNIGEWVSVVYGDDVRQPSRSRQRSSRKRAS